QIIKELQADQSQEKDNNNSSDVIPNKLNSTN
ncbi:MAG: NAD(P)H-quinone oxidoreductase subunit I, partial [Euryarchaeota archaeon]|nr:NAD(P)H-quinone oxidoreductase subunit I [Euryarchaeota archaeon]